jgi:hypothetical protein
MGTINPIDTIDTMDTIDILRTGRKSRFVESVTYVNHISVRRPIEAVFDYMTAPGYWPDYHPISKRVIPDPDPDRWRNYPLWPEKYPLPEPRIKSDVFKPFSKDEVIIEDISLGRLTQRIHWICLESAKLASLSIFGRSDDFGGMLTFIEYSYSPNGKDGKITDIRRLVMVTKNSLAVRLMDVLVMNKVAARIWDQAMNNMKRILESK